MRRPQSINDVRQRARDIERGAACLPDAEWCTAHVLCAAHAIHTPHATAIARDLLIPLAVMR